MKKKIVVVVSIVTLALGAGIFTKALQAGKASAQPAFTLRSRVININPKDGTQSTLEKVRYVSSGGNWRVVLTNPDGKHAEYFFENGRGFFNVDHVNKVLRQNPKGAATPPVPMTSEQLRAHPQFVGTTQIFGLTAYILRVKNQQTDLPESDTYRAVELGNAPLKSVLYSQGVPVVIDEPVSLSFGEPDPPSLKGPDYPVG